MPMRLPFYRTYTESPYTAQTPSVPGRYPAQPQFAQAPAASALPPYTPAARPVGDRGRQQQLLAQFRSTPPTQTPHTPAKIRRANRQMKKEERRQLKLALKNSRSTNKEEEKFRRDLVRSLANAPPGTRSPDAQYRHDFNKALADSQRAYAHKELQRAIDVVYAEPSARVARPASQQDREIVSAWQQLLAQKQEEEDLQRAIAASLGKPWESPRARAQREQRELETALENSKITAREEDARRQASVRPIPPRSS